VSGLCGWVMCEMSEWVEKPRHRVQQCNIPFDFYVCVCVCVCVCAEGVLCE